MKKIKQLLLVSLLTFCVGTTFSQTADSLSVFPNPFNVSTTIHFDIVQSDTITLRVFNAVGQTISTFFNSTILPSGSYDINLLGDSLADGIYIVRLDIGSTKTINKKAIKNGSTSSIADTKAVDKFFIFPNPTNGIINIKSEGIKNVKIYSLQGQLLYDGNFDNANTVTLQPNISNTGLLLIEVTTSNGIFRNKLILNNN